MQKYNLLQIKNPLKETKIFQNIIYLYNILGWSSFPSIRPIIRPGSSSSRKKKMMEWEEDNDSWRRQQFIHTSFDPPAAA